MKIISAKNAQCPLAKHQLYIHSSGKVYPCSFLQGKYLLGDIHQQSIAEIWEASAHNQFIQDHLAGNNKLCSKEQPVFDCHYFHKNLEKSSSTPSLKRLDIMIDSKCNLACKMCTNRLENSRPLSKFFWNELKNILPHLEEIELVGGEPFINSTTDKLLTLILDINPNIRFLVTTNGNYSLSTSLKQKLNRLNIYSLSVSIDSLQPENYRRIRVNGNFSQVMRSLKFFQILSKNKKFHLQINFLLQKENHQELEEMFQFGKENSITIHPILLQKPHQYSIMDFNISQRKKIVYSYLLLVNQFKSIEILNIVIKLIKTLPQTIKVELLEQVLQLKYEIQHSR